MGVNNKLNFIFVIQLRFLKEDKSTLLLENERLLLAGGSSDKTEGRWEYVLHFQKIVNVHLTF